MQISLSFTIPLTDLELTRLDTMSDGCTRSTLSPTCTNESEPSGTGSMLVRSLDAHDLVGVLHVELLQHFLFK